MTPPFNLVVSKPRIEGALELLARGLHAEGVELPGVTGALPEVDEFAAVWEPLADVRRRQRIAHGIYAARMIQVSDGCTGTMRRASPADRDLVIPELRGRGYASAVTAELSAEVLAGRMGLLLSLNRPRQPNVQPHLQGGRLRVRL